jgi:hypothetical protein
MKTLWCKNQENPSDGISHAWAPLILLQRQEKAFVFFTHHCSNNRKKHLFSLLNIAPTTWKSGISILTNVEMTGKGVVFFTYYCSSDSKIVVFFTYYCSNDMKKYGFLYRYLLCFQRQKTWFSLFLIVPTTGKRGFFNTYSVIRCTHTLRVGRLGQNRQGRSGRQQGSTECQQWIRCRPAQCQHFTSIFFFFVFFYLFDKSLHYNLQSLLNITNIIYDYEHTTRKRKKK